FLERPILGYGYIASRKVLLGVVLWCVFRTKPATYSGANRPPNPAQTGHRSGANQPPWFGGVRLS
ncbi:MAG TPA: hypothetical protein VIK64_17200, partial [Anaerolineales bacterium]